MSLPLRLALALLAPATLAAQAEPWLSEVPTAKRVTTELQAGSSRINTARAAAALFAFKNLMESLIYAPPPSPPSAAAKTRLDEMLPERDRVANAQYAKDGETYKFERCKTALDESPEFHRELLDRFFTEAWIKANGARLDPRRWKAPLGLAPGTRLTSSPHPDCGPMTVAAAPAPPPPAPVPSPAPAPAASGATVTRMLTQAKQLLDAEQPAKARSVLDSAVRLAPRNPRALYLLGMALQGIALKDSTKKRFFSDGDSLFTLAFNLEDKDAELLVEVAEALSPVSDQEKAFEKALDLDPPPKLAARAHMGLGWWSHFFAMYSQAQVDFKEAARLDPQNVEAVYAVGLMYVRMDDIPNARGIHRQLLQLDRKYAARLLQDINKALKKPAP